MLGLVEAPSKRMAIAAALFALELPFSVNTASSASEYPFCAMRQI